MSSQSSDRGDLDHILAILETQGYDGRALRLKTIEEIGHKGDPDPDILSALARILHHSDVALQYASLWALAMIGIPAIPVLVDAVRGKRCVLRRMAARRLVHMGNEGVETLVELLGSDDPGVRAAVSESLGLLKQDNHRATQALVLALEDCSVDVRRESARSLGKIKPHSERAREALTRVANTDNGPFDPVRPAAKWALEHMETTCEG